tara:strand:+ start:171 stop:455 length:285 start_codon:yes stop_codon:yes gene_type:complete
MVALKCKICGYEVNGKPSDYAPVCTPTPEIPQCNECIECLLYCACNAQKNREQFTDLIEECEDDIFELQSELQIALDSRQELEEESKWHRKDGE